MTLPLQLVIGSEVLGLILSGGAAAMIAAVVQAYRSLRDGSRADDRDAFADLDKERNRERKRANRAEKLRDYWHRRAASLEFILVSKLGIEVLPPTEAMPPEEDDEES